MSKGIRIEIKNLNLTLSNTEILKNINLTIQEGSIHCLVGPNGGGKTSLLRCILGQMPFTGEISFHYDEKEATGENGKYTIGYVPQILDFERTLPITVEDFMCMTYQTKPCFLGSTKKYKPIMEDLLKHLSMYDKRKRLLGNLSGGERQRISIARAFLKNAPIILLDEISASLDVENEMKIQESLNKLIKNKTVLVISHRMKSIENANKIIVMENGKIESQGNHNELLEKSKVYNTMVKNSSLAENYSY